MGAINFFSKEMYGLKWVEKRPFIELPIHRTECLKTSVGTFGVSWLFRHVAQFALVKFSARQNGHQRKRHVP